MARLTDPQNREEFKKLLRAKQGEPFNRANVSDMQVEIAIDEALKWFEDFHYNGTENVYWVHELTATEIATRTIIVPPEITAVVCAYPVSANVVATISNVWSGGYQLALELAFSSSSQLSNYYITMMNLELFNQILVGEVPLEFNRVTRQLHFRGSKTDWVAGEGIAFDAYKTIDPEEHPAIWSDAWLIRYANAKLQYQIGYNLSKFVDIPLMGGARLDATRMMNDAKDEMTRIEEGVIRGYSRPPRDWVG